MSASNATIGTTANPGTTWTIQNANSAQGGRYHDLLFLMEGSLTSLDQAREGCLPGPWDNTADAVACWLVEPSSGMTCTVRPGAAVVGRDTKVGPYGVVSESSVEITFADGDATNDRIDRVDLQVMDGALGDNGDTSITQLVVTTGTAAGDPAVPDAPDNSIPICQVSVPSGTDAITDALITMGRKSAALRGCVRVLLEGDSLDEDGINVGELRDTNVLSVPQIQRWAASSATWETVADNGSSVSTYNHFTGSQTVTDINGNTYTGVKSGTTLFGDTFVAPESGIVEITWGCNAKSGIDGSSLFIGTAVRTGSTIGSGTVESNVSDDEAMIVSVLDSVPASRSRRVEDLTAGDTYNVEMLARNSSSAAGVDSVIDRPFVIVKPQPR